MKAQGFAAALVIVELRRSSHRRVNRPQRRVTLPHGRRGYSGRAADSQVWSYRPITEWSRCSTAQHHLVARAGSADSSDRRRTHQPKTNGRQQEAATSSLSL